MTKTYKELKLNDRFTKAVPLTFSKKDGVEIPDEIHMVPIGEWKHDLYGPILINNSDIREFAQNFNAGIRKGVYITAGHEGFVEQPAVGWVRKVEIKDDGLWGTVDWNELGKGMLADKQFKFFSPELCRDYEDPQDHQVFRNVITGGALTKSPYFKELQAIVFSDKNIKSNFSENNNMNLKELLAKEVSELSDEEKAFIKEHQAELTEEEKAKVTAIIDAPADDADTEVKETEEEKQAREEKEKGDANEAAGLNRDGSTKEPIQASEKITISKQEFAILTKKANDGAEAYSKLQKMEVAKEVDALIFSEGNKDGKFLQKSKDKLSAFMEKLNVAQRKEFSELMKSVSPVGDSSFKEIGNGGADNATVFAEVEKKVTELMSKDSKLQYSDALKQVLASEKGLEERYDRELTPVGKKA